MDLFPLTPELYWLNIAKLLLRPCSIARLASFLSSVQSQCCDFRSLNTAAGSSAHSPKCLLIHPNRHAYTFCLDHEQVIFWGFRVTSSQLLLCLCSSGAASIVVDTTMLQWSLDCGAIPLVCPVGCDTTGCSTLLNSVDVTVAISRALQPLKVMFLNSWGGLCNQNLKVSVGVIVWLPHSHHLDLFIRSFIIKSLWTLQKNCRTMSCLICHFTLVCLFIVSLVSWFIVYVYVCVFQVLGTVSLPSDLPLLSSAEWLCVQERRQVNAIAHLLNQLSPESSAVITSANTLLTELFSHKGEPRRYTIYSHIFLAR